MSSILRCAAPVVLLTLAGACTPPAEDLQTGEWRAVVTLPGGPLPFGLELARTPDESWRAYLRNGAERVEIRQVRYAEGRLTMDMPGFNNRIAARRVEPGRLTGTLTLTKSGGELQVMPFEAAHGETHRFVAAPEPGGVDVGGRWSVTFTEDGGRQYAAVGEFEQRGGQVTGTFLTTSGDHRYLAGNLHDGTLSLSTFDGAHAYLHVARPQPDGTLRGDFWSGTKWHESWVAVRDADARLPDPATLTWLKPGYERFDFTFPDLQGRSVSLSDRRFAGKVVVVMLAGSWCPNCHDEAAFMAPFYESYRDAGLEAIGLMFEHFGDFERAVETARAFRAKFAIDYPLLIAGTSNKDLASEALPMLNRVLAFPTTIVVDRSGRVRHIHTGFAGPGTGEHYRQFQREFTALIDSLLAEPAGAATAGA